MKYFVLIMLIALSACREAKPVIQKARVGDIITMKVTGDKYQVILVDCPSDCRYTIRNRNLGWDTVSDFEFDVN